MPPVARTTRYVTLGSRKRKSAQSVAVRRTSIGPCSDQEPLVLGGDQVHPALERKTRAHELATLRPDVTPETGVAGESLEGIRELPGIPSFGDDAAALFID